MCGIVGAVAKTNIVPVLIDGIARLEYRGYDSTGLAIVRDDHTLDRLVSMARVADLARRARAENKTAVTGISHTRWATHGAPTETNAHPITSHHEIALVHNGVIENHEALRDTLQKNGYTFVTQTDTEVIAHLVHSYWHGEANKDLLKAVQLTTMRLIGAYAIAVISSREPHRIVGARSGSPLVVGKNEHGYYVASDPAALTPVTHDVVYLEEGDTVDLTPDDVTYYARESNNTFTRTTRALTHIPVSDMSVNLGSYRHFMQKEIFEQPRAIADTLEGIVEITPMLFGDQAEAALSGVDSLLILACGTSYYAGQVGKQWVETLARLPVSVEIASEYWHRDSVPNPNALVVVVSQSGETADTLAALKHAKALGHQHTLAICNVATSAMVRQTEMTFLTHAGIEVGVASTKAFTTQLVALFLLALTLAKLRGRLSADDESKHLKALRHLPSSVQSALALEPQTIAWAETFKHKEHALFLGRGLSFPIAEEGALKLKEISYIHAEAYPAGELKHGPLALVDAEMPVVAIAPNDVLVEKLKANLQEVRARGAELYVIADLDTPLMVGDGIRVLRVPEHASLLSPIIHVAPLQLLAYHAAVMRGTDVDKPRNLAKSVTVE